MAAEERSTISVENFAEPMISYSRAQATEKAQRWCDAGFDGPEMDEAISSIETAITIAELAATTVSEKLQSELWQQKAGFHTEKFRRLSGSGDLEMSITCYRRCAQLDPKNRWALIAACFNIFSRYEITGDRQTLEECFKEIPVLWSAVPEDPSTLIDLLLYTSVCLYERSELGGSSDDLDVAIELLRLWDSVENPVEEWSHILSLMSIAILTARFEINGDLQDLEEAGRLVAQLKLNSKIGPSHRHYEQEVFEKFHLAKFEVFQDQDDMNELIKSCLFRLASIDENKNYPSSNKISATWRFARLTLSCFYWNHESLLLGKAYSWAMDAYNMIQSKKSEWPIQRDEAEVLFHLGEIPRSRFVEYNYGRFLNDSVTYLRSCVLLTSRGEDSFGRRASALVGTLRIRADSGFVDQGQRLDDMHEAQYWVKRMVLGPKPSRPSDRTGMILQIGHLVRVLPGLGVMRNERTIWLYAHAVEIDCIQFQDKIDALRSAGEAWTQKGRSSQNLEDLQTALEIFHRLEAFSDLRGTRCTTGHMPSLATLYYALYELKFDSKYAVKCAEVNYEIFANSNYPKTTKLQAVNYFAVFAASLTAPGDPTQYVEEVPLVNVSFDEALSQALECIDEIISENFTRSQQLVQMRHYHLYPLHYVWFAQIAKKEAREIVRTYDRGRSIILTRLLNKKVSIEDLKFKLPELAGRYQALTEQLSGSRAKPLFKHQPVDDFELEAELRGVINEIRGNVGFEHFKRPCISDDEFGKLSQGSPIVMLVAGLGSSSGCALVIVPGSVYCQTLSGYSQDECQKQYGHLNSAIERWQSSGKDNGELLKVLNWLWHTATEPILDRLGIVDNYRTGDGGELPRVWWILCDWANRLPIHAAGDYRKAEESGLPCTVMDRAISSYSPTLQSLTYSRARISALNVEKTACQAQQPFASMKTTRDSGLQSQDLATQTWKPADVKRAYGDAVPGSNTSSNQDQYQARRIDSVASERNNSVGRSANSGSQTQAVTVHEKKSTIHETPADKVPLALLAAMPKTPDHLPLPNALSEINIAAGILSPSYTISSFSDPAPTRKDIIKNLQTCTIAHLACHGFADPQDPLKSKLLLSDYGPKPLRVSFIMRMEMKNCQLAYLSACKTAVNHDQQLAEEALHICGAFQMAGVPNIIATLRDVPDQEACTVAGDFYAGLKVEGNTVDLRRSATALHAATLKARRAGVSPFVWAGYAHYGA